MEEVTSSSSASTSNTYSGSTGSSIAVVQPNLFLARCLTTSLEQRLVTESIFNVAVAADTTASAGPSQNDSCERLHNAAKSSGTTAVMAGSTAIYADDTNAIKSARTYSP